MCKRRKCRMKGGARLWISAAAVLLAMGSVAVAAGQQAPAPQKPPAVSEKPQGEMRSAAALADPVAAPENENAMLLQLAKELKADVDKTNKDMLSLNVIRKALEIEQFSRKVQREIAANRGAGGK